MERMTREEFLDQACGKVRPKREREALRQELAGHLDEKANELAREEGLSPEAAEAAAIAQMGDALEIAGAFGRARRGRMNRASKIVCGAAAAAAGVCVALSAAGAWTGPPAQTRPEMINNKGLVQASSTEYPDGEVRIDVKEDGGIMTIRMAGGRDNLTDEERKALADELTRIGYEWAAYCSAYAGDGEEGEYCVIYDAQDGTITMKTETRSVNAMADEGAGKYVIWKMMDGADGVAEGFQAADGIADGGALEGERLYVAADGAIRVAADAPQRRNGGGER